MKGLLRRILRNRQPWIESKPFREIPIWHEPLDDAFDRGYIDSLRVFKDVIVWPSESVCANREGKLISTAFDARWTDLIEPHLLNYPIESMSGVCTSFDFLWSKNNHYHQLIDCHSRLFALRKISEFRNVKLLLPHDWTERYIDLILLLFPEIRPVRVSSRRRLRCETYLHLPALSIPRISGDKTSLGKFSALSAPYFELHREVIGAIKPPITAKRIYLLRRTANKRRILNQNDVDRTLREYGFVEVFPERMSVIEQTTTFAQAEIVIGPHGAAMSNFVAAGPNTTFVELLSCPLEKAPNYFGNMGESMFKVLQIPGNGTNIHDDFSVDIAKLEAVLQLSK